jgi:hypothetical protein
VDGATGGLATGGLATGGLATGGTPSSSGGAAASGGYGPSSGGQGSGAAEGAGGGVGAGTGGGPSGPATLQLMQGIVFYDGYAGVSDGPLPEGVVRQTNSLMTTRLTGEQLALIQPHLELQVTIGALCDNYDRIGSVRLALVRKGAESYEPEVTPHIELGRFITPFMDKNVEPLEVPYSWDIDHVAAILRSSKLSSSYDFWLELSVFGVPYAANEEVSGCAGRSDVFEGSVSLFTDSSSPHRAVDVLLPLAFEEPFNDYQTGASDQLGTTEKTLEFSLENGIEDAEIVLILSHHGANSGGEEYERRHHFVSLDGEPVLEFTPGRQSCEPFRKYNTQGNGIYGPTPRSDAEWQSFSNWCPGDVIDIRRIPWGAASAGPHALIVEVPDAVFVGDEGNFPLSVFVLGRVASP